MVAVTVYPRIRGEHMCKDANLSRSDRFIPAYAGNTSGSITVTLLKTVYPRIRGEHAVLYKLMSPRAGLSPHTRGTLSEESVYPVHLRFIPAYAGNTPVFAPDCHKMAVYPRIRGEHSRYKPLNHNGFFYPSKSTGFFAVKSRGLHVRRDKMTPAADRPNPPAGGDSHPASEIQNPTRC